MRTKLLKAFKSLLVALLWIGVWYLAAFRVGNKLLLPSPYDTAVALLDLISEANFYKAVAFTLIRVLLGLVIGIIFGVSIAILCHKFNIVKSVFSPAISIIRSTPVASFIVLLWVLLDGSALSVVVAFLMVMPIVWQNTLDGFSSIPQELIEIAQVYELSYRRRYEVLVLPVLSQYIFPAVITSVGLAWKSEIAAEIIAYTKDSIGMHINDAKTFLLTPMVFAWTVVIVVMSLCIEFFIKKLLGRIKK